MTWYWNRFNFLWFFILNNLSLMVFLGLRRDECWNKGEKTCNFIRTVRMWLSKQLWAVHISSLKVDKNIFFKIISTCISLGNLKREAL